MKWDQAKGNGSWVCWGESLADEIQVGTREELIGRLQTKYAYSKGEGRGAGLAGLGDRVRNKGNASQIRSRGRETLFGFNTEQDHYCYCFYYQPEGLKFKEEIAMLKTNYLRRLTEGVGSLRVTTALKRRQEGKMVTSCCGF